MTINPADIIIENLDGEGYSSISLFKCMFIISNSGTPSRYSGFVASGRRRNGNGVGGGFLDFEDQEWGHGVPVRQRRNKK